MPPAERSDKLLTQGVVVLLLVGPIVVVFWPQIIGALLFIGESDRLNSYLNMRLAEYDSLAQYGRVTNWNPTMFGGFSTAALHWMNPGTDPIAYLLQLFPRERIFQVLSYVSIALVLLACTTAYFYIRDLAGPGAIAAIGAVCYGLSVFAIHRMAQVDNAFLTLVLLPCGLLAVRRVHAGNLVVPFVALTATLAALVFWGFLQEVAYAFYFIAAYALYRALISYRKGVREFVAPLLVFGLAAVIAVLFAAPRLITVAAEFLLLDRMSSVWYYNYAEFLRFFHEGIYGRYFQENQLLGNSMNLHEGLQLVSSTTLAVFVFLGAMRPSRWLEAIPGALLCAMVLALWPISSMETVGLVSTPLASIVVYAVALLAGISLLTFVGSYLRIGSTMKRLVPTAPRPADVAFLLFAVTVLLLLILVSEFYYLVHLAFGGADFTHSRLSVLLLLPLCTLFSIYLAELPSLPLYDPATRHVRSAGWATTLGVILAAALASWIIHGPIIDWLVPRDAFQFEPFDDTFAMPAVVVKTAVTMALLAALMVVVVRCATCPLDSRQVATLVVATFALTETVTYAHFKINGSHTRNYPVAFPTYNYMNVPRPAMRPPGKDELRKFADLLETDSYRAVLVGGRTIYSGAKAAHVSQFWRARMVSGYGTGVQKRLAELPWPDGVRTLRAIELRTMADVRPELLALLNVKYILVLTDDLYYNVTSASENAQEVVSALQREGFPVELADVDGVKFGLMRNPVTPLPRHFLVEAVTGVASTPTVKGAYLEAEARVGDPGRAERTPVRMAVDRLVRRSLAEGFYGTVSFDASGPVQAAYHDDRIGVRVAPSSSERFLVLNTTYHPDWHARVGATDLPVYAVNGVMIGVMLPPQIERIELRFEPFAARRGGYIMMLVAVVLFAGAAVALARKLPPARRPGCEA